MGIAVRLHMHLCLGLLPIIVSTTDRPIAGVSCGQFGTVRLKFKQSTYIQETVGDTRGMHTERFKRGNGWQQITELGD